jgi:hypothetical protein
MMRLKKLPAGAMLRVPAIVLAIASACLTACSSAPPLFSSDGRPTSMVQCPASGGWSNCQENARAMCGGNYDVLDQSTDNGQNGLLIACKSQ